MARAKKVANPTHVDLNLLRVFDAVFEDRNLSRAGKRLHLSQSAISHALARLREGMQDELFVRTPRGMEPTAHALAIAAPLREALHRIYDTLGTQSFSPDNATRRFVVAANDYVTSLLLTRVSRTIDTTARMVDLVIRPSTRLDLAEQLDVGRIDLAIGVFAQVPERFRSQGLWMQHDALVMRAGHPLSKRPAHVEDLAKYPLVTVSLGGQEEGAVGGFIVERGLARQSEMFNRHALEDALAAIGAKARLRVTVPHSLAVPGLLQGTDMLSILPLPLAQELARTGDVVHGALPYHPPDDTVRLLWHNRYAEDPAHTWLRRQIIDLHPPGS
jgi:DNA-binding transcriptional LysR family regulator